MLEEFATVDEGLTMMSMQIRKSIHNAMRQAVAAEDLSQNEIEVLLILGRGFWDTAGEIAQMRGYSRSMVSKSVDQLIRKEYILSRQDQQDRRIQHLQLLPKGQEVTKRLQQTRKQILSQLCRGITPEEGEIFRGIVKKLADNAKDMLPPEGKRSAERKD